MEFVDKTGHIFSVQSWDEKPIGYEYEEAPYTFWIDSDKTSVLSINNYYMRPIYMLVPYYTDKDNLTFNEMGIRITATIDSQVFKIVNTNEMQDLINDGCNIKNMINIADTELLSEITDEDLTYIKVKENNHKFFLVPFYIIGNASEVGTWSTNMLIHVYCDDNESYVDETWTYITIGGTFQNVYEQLLINGANFGIELPRDILRSVYRQSFIDEVFNEQLYNEKLKEYMINYMAIKGEQGNFRSALASLKWFGYGDKITLTKLLQTDNQFKQQYIHDFFNTSNDVIESFATFRNSTFVALSMPLNQETDDEYPFDFTAEFIGENKPVMENLMDKMVPIEEGSNETSIYWKPYYDFTFFELGLKLSCLKYYYDKYFLPIHLAIHSASMRQTVYANDVKLINKTVTTLSEQIINIEDDDLDVHFPDTNELYFTQQIHWVDSNYNEFFATNDTDDWYYINDTCLNVPIQFSYADKPYNCVLLLEKDNDYTGTFSYIMSVDQQQYYNSNVIILDRYGEEFFTETAEMSFSEDKKQYSIWYNGIDDLNRALRHRYAQNISTTYIYQNVETEDEGTVSVGQYVVTVLHTDFTISESSSMHVIYNNGINYTVYIPGYNELNLNIIDQTIATAPVSIIPPVYIRYKYNQSEIKAFFINSVNVKDDVHINYMPTSNVIFESHFSFVQQDYKHNTVYKDFVIYPKMLCNPKINRTFNRYNLADCKNNYIEYWVNSNFRLRLLVNNRWYEYDFITRMPELQIDFGTLKYKYWSNDEHYLTNFNQLNALNYTLGATDNELQFNSFMYQPQLVDVNHINVIEDFVKYLELTNVHYVSGEMVPDEAFYQYIEINSQRIYIDKNTVGNNIRIPISMLSAKNIFTFVYKDTTYLLKETETLDDAEFDYDSYKTMDDLTLFEVTKLNNDFLFTTEDDEEAFVFDTAEYKNSRYLTVYYDDENSDYYTLNDDDEEEHYTVFEALHYNLSHLNKAYIETKNIISSDSYLNQIHIFDLYKKTRKSDDGFWVLHNNINVRCRNIRFSHDDYTNRTLYIQGCGIDGYNTNGITDRKAEQLNDTQDMSAFNTRDDFTRYSVYWNDKIRKDSTLKPDGYTYYQEIGLDGYPTGNFTTKSIHKIPVITSFSTETEDGLTQYTISKQYLKLQDFENDFINGELTNNGKKWTFHIGNVEYTIKYDVNDSDKHLYIDRQDKILGTDTSDVNYDIKYLKFNISSHQYEYWTPTSDVYADFYEAITDENNDNYYKFEVTFYYTKYYSQPNIEHEYNANAVTEKDGKYYGKIRNNNGEYITAELIPYTEYGYVDDKLTDAKLDKEISNKVTVKQPSMQWYDVTSEEFEYMDDELMNEYWLTINDLEADNESTDHAQYVNAEYAFKNDYEDNLKYQNYLMSDLTGLSGVVNLDYMATYQEWDEENSCLSSTRKIWEGFKIALLITDEDGTKRLENTRNEYFTLTGNEQSVIALFMIDDYPRDDEGNYVYFSARVEPKICKSYNTYTRLAYDKTYHSSDDTISVTINDKTYVYGRNTSDNVKKLYNEFFHTESYTYSKTSFNDDTVDLTDMSFSLIEPNIKIDDFIEYDFYLMHDFDYWYAVYISKVTCDKVIKPIYLNVPEADKEIYYDGTSYDDYSSEYYVRNFDGEEDGECAMLDYLKSLGYEDIEIGDVNPEYCPPNDDEHNITEGVTTKYKLMYNRSGKEFLMNRYYYEPTNGVNHFETNDLIVATVANNDRLPVNVELGSKWLMTPMSLNVTSRAETDGNAEMVILDCPDGDTEYHRGYYNITVRYCLDTVTQQQQFKTAPIRIG